jgi:hypothetical protein
MVSPSFWSPHALRAFDRLTFENPGTRPVSTLSANVVTTQRTLSRGSRRPSTCQVGKLTLVRRETGGCQCFKIPIVVGQIDYDRLGGTAHNHPDKTAIGGLIDFHVRQPRWNMDEIAPARDRTELTAFAPSNKGLPFEYIGDRLLTAMMMDASAGTGLNDENSAPKRGLNSHIVGNRGTALGSRRLSRLRIEARRLDDAKGAISAHDHLIVWA